MKYRPERESRLGTTMKTWRMDRMSKPICACSVGTKFRLVPNKMSETA